MPKPISSPKRALRANVEDQPGDWVAPGETDIRNRSPYSASARA